jgi:hypothetical protein
MILRWFAASPVFLSSLLTTLCGSAGGCAQVLDIDVLPIGPLDGGTKDRDASDGDGGPEVESFSIQETTVQYNWDVGQYHWSGDTQLLLYPSDAPNADQDFAFEAVPGVKDGWSICNLALSICLSDADGYVSLGPIADTWVTTPLSGHTKTIQNYTSKRYIETPPQLDAGEVIPTGSVAGAWVFYPPH